MLLCIAFPALALTANLEYGEGINNDPGNPGTAAIGGAVNLSVAGSDTEGLPESGLCTLWEVTLVKWGVAITSCRGSQVCCNSHGFEPSSQAWDSPLILTHVLSYNGTPYTSHNDSVRAELSFVNGSVDLNSGWTSEVPVTFLDKSPPEVTLAGPADNAWLNSTHAELSFTPSDDGGILSCSIIADGSVVRTLASPLSGALSSAEADLGDGNHSWAVECSDLAGNIARSSQRALGIDITDPAVLLVSPGEPYVSLLRDLPFTFIVSDNACQRLSCAVVIDSGSYPVQAGNAVLTSVNLSALSQGSHVWQVRCADDAGRVALSSQRHLNIVSYSISMPKSVYNLSEPVVVSLSSPDSVTFAISITYMPVSELIVAEPATISNPFVYRFNSTNHSGGYQLNVSLNFLNTSLTEIIPFSVDNSILVAESSEKVGFVGQQMAFSANASFGISPYSYLWKFNESSNDTAARLNRTFSKAGLYAVTLVVSDYSGNRRDMAFDVRVYNKVEFIVLDNQTRAPLNSTRVRIGDSTNYTLSDGRAVLSVMDGEYGVEFSAPGHKGFLQLMRFNQSQQFTVGLDALSPFPVELYSPGRNATVNASTAYLYYSIGGDLAANCSLRFRQGSMWIPISSQIAEPNSRESFVIGDLVDNGLYIWQVLCVNSRGESLSEQRTFSVRFPISNANLIPLIEDKSAYVAVLEQGVAEGAAAINSLDERSWHVAESLGLIQDLEIAGKEIEAIAEALRAMGEPGADLSSGQERLDALEQRIADVKKAIPKGFRLIDSTKFINRLSSEDIAELSEEYLNRTNIYLDIKERADFLQQNKNLQNLMTITNMVYVAEVTFLFKPAETLTLVEKAVSTEAESAGAVLLESIPKEVAASAAEISFIGNYTVLEDDPLIELSGAHLDYIVKGKIDLAAAESIRSMFLMSPKSRASTPVGYSVASSPYSLGKKGLTAGFMLIAITGTLVFVFGRARIQSLATFLKKPRVQDVYRSVAMELPLYSGMAPPDEAALSSPSAVAEEGRAFNSIAEMPQKTRAAEARHSIVLAPSRTSDIPLPQSVAKVMAETMPQTVFEKEREPVPVSIILPRAAAARKCAPSCIIPPNKVFAEAVPPDKVFYTNNGQVLHSVEELVGALKTMDDSAFSHHVTEHKNDFSNWVRDVIGDDRLAIKLFFVNSRKDTISILEKHRK